jgi:hypothetical protein
MANATTLVGFRSALLDTTAASQSLALDPDLMYSITHLGRDAAGAADANDIKLELSKKDGSAADPAVAVRTADTDAVILIEKSSLIVRGVRGINYIRFGGAPQIVVAEAIPDFLFK